MRNSRFFLLSLFLFSFLIRLIHLFQMKGAPTFEVPLLDELFHHEWAKEICSGDWIGREAYFRAPLYPYFLGILYLIFGVNPFQVKFIQIILGSINVVLIYLLGRKVFGRAVGTLSGIISSLYGPFIFFETQLLIPVLAIFTSLLSLLILIHSLPTNRFRGWFLSGILFGFTSIARPNLLLFTPLLLLWHGMRTPKMERRKGILIGALFVGGVLFILFPVTLRNYLVSKDFVPISYQGGINFYAGNNPIADGCSVALPGFGIVGWEEILASNRMAEKEMGRRLKPREISNYWRRKGIEFILKNPGKFLLLTGKKILLFWNGIEISDGKEIYIQPMRSTLMKLLLFKKGLAFPFGVIAPLALLGIFLTLSRWREVGPLHLFVFSVMGSLLPFFVCSRYRIPALPILILFAAYTLHWIYIHVRKRDWNTLILPFSFLLLTGTLSNLNLFRIPYQKPARYWFDVGLAHYNLGRHKDAITSFKRSLEYNPKNYKAHYSMGLLYWMGRREEWAEEEFEEALKIHPCYVDGLINLGILMAEKKRMGESLLYLERGVECDPYSIPARYNLGKAYLEKGDEAKAIRELKRAIALPQDPSNRDALLLAKNLMGSLYARKGEKNLARKEWKEVLRMDPENPLAKKGIEKLEMESHP